MLSGQRVELGGVLGQTGSARPGISTAGQAAQPNSKTPLPTTKPTSSLPYRGPRCPDQWGYISGASV